MYVYKDQSLTYKPCKMIFNTKWFNRIYLSRKYSQILKSDNDLEAGEHWSVNRDDISNIKWHDKIIVSLLLNVHNPENAPVIQRSWRDGFVIMFSGQKVWSVYDEIDRKA